MSVVPPRSPLQTPHATSTVAPSSSAGGGVTWLSLTEFAKELRQGRNAIRAMIRDGRIEGRKVPGPGPDGYMWVVNAEAARERLRGYKFKPPSQKCRISPETWAHFCEVWRRFEKGECGPIIMARPKGDWMQQVTHEGRMTVLVEDWAERGRPKPRENPGICLRCRREFGRKVTADGRLERVRVWQAKRYCSDECRKNRRRRAA